MALAICGVISVIKLCYFNFNSYINNIIKFKLQHNAVNRLSVNVSHTPLRHD